MWHILDRFLIHFVASAALVLMVWFALRLWTRTNSKVSRWISPDQTHLLVISALVVFGLATLREPIDVYLGQAPFKAVTDQFSWFCGCGCSVWGLYRFGARKND